ncbi:protein-lysine N-methyltransferase M142.8-like isoform X1, partial [Argonauta hians]
VHDFSCSLPCCDKFYSSLSTKRENCFSLSIMNNQLSENETYMEIETSCDRLGITIAEKEDKLRYYYTMSSSEESEESEEEKFEVIRFDLPDSEIETETKVEEEIAPKPKKNPYSESTSESVAHIASKLCSDKDYQIGCICCPLVFNTLQKNLSANGKLFLFDKDKDKVAKAGKNFIHYNFSDNKKLKEFKGAFDVLLMFAPKLSDDPVEKIVYTLEHLKNEKCKILLVVSNTFVRVDDDFRKSIEKLKLVEINWGITTANVKKDIYYFSNHIIEE